jgi:hypothetical protein
MEHRDKAGKARKARKGRAAGRNQRSEIRRQRSGLKLVSDLRLLASVIDGFYDFYGFNDLPLTAYCLPLTTGYWIL